MNIALIDGHPDPDSARLCHGLAEAYAAGAASAGHAVRRMAIADLDLPLLQSAEEFETGAPPPAAVEAQQAIAWAGHLVLIYPLWLGTMPAALKALLEQTLRPGFALDNSGRYPAGRLQGKSARIVVTMGMPALIYRWYFGAHSLKSLERHILKFCGIKPVRETLFGSVGEASPAKREKWLAEMRALGAKAR